MSYFRVCCRVVAALRRENTAAAPVVAPVVRVYLTHLRTKNSVSVRSVPHGTMNGKSANGSAGGMACIEGLPPLPKSLSGLLNSSGGSWRDMERMYVKKTMIQDDLSRGRNNADNLLANKPANLDAALALLRKEMVTCSRPFITPMEVRLRIQPDSPEKLRYFGVVSLVGDSHAC